MKALSVSEVAQMAEGRLIAGDAAMMVNAVSTDTRTISQGSLFVALIGDRFDAHDFVGQAVEKGATALLVNREVEVSEGVAVIQVEDTLVGLQALARQYRRLLKIRSVVITGSNGKTSTKDMIRTVLGDRHDVNATKGNLNNHIGLPLTILSTEETDDFGIWEIGMNHPGEIAPLAEIAGPDIAVITNIGTAHIGNMGSREAIAQEKGMLAEAVGEQGCVVLNANDAFTSSIEKRTRAKVLTAGIETGDVKAMKVKETDQGTAFEVAHGDESAPVHLPVLGRHMISNALLAVAVGLAAGLTLADSAAALNQVQLSPGRLQLVEAHGVRVVNDAYNANPDSMRASLTTVSRMETTGKRWAMLGQMGELGEDSAQAHRDIGRLAGDEGFDHVCSVGEGARGYTEALSENASQAVHHFASHQEAAAFLTENAAPGDVVLLKGSRAAAMDTILELYAASSP